MYIKELRSIITKLEDAHKVACENSNTPQETVRRFIQEVGSATSTQCVAAMVRRASWDGRISRDAKAWANSVELSEEWEKRIDDAYCNAIHMAHLSQIAEAMSAELQLFAAKQEQEKSTKKVYYFPDNAYVDAFFGRGDWVCVDQEELHRLAVAWEMDFSELREQVHEATPAEIAEYGIYDS